MNLPRPRKGRGLQRNTMERVARMDVIEDGECLPRICGLDAACKSLPNKQHKCICPHDSLPPTPDKKCPIRKTVSETPPPMYNIIPPTSNPMQLKHSNIDNALLGHISARPTTAIESATWTVLGACVLVLLVIVTSLCWWKKRHLIKFIGRSESRKASSCSPSPRYLNKSVLVAERYASNPQYSGTAVLPEPPPLPVPCSVPLIMRSALRLHQELGEGCFGKVYRGELLDVPDVEDDDVEAGAVHQVAVKVLKSSASRQAEEDFMREVEIMSGFRHPNILTLLGIVQRDGQGEPWMVFEFMAHGDLAEVLRANSRQLWRPLPGLPALSPVALHTVALQVAAGMRYLAAQHFVHRDLACRNCLVGAGLVVKIADFGMSRDVYTCDYYKIGGSRMLPVRWMSPESVMYGRFTLESDVWSYGVVLWEIFSLGRQPYYGHSNEEVVKLILQGIMLIPPEKCPPIICDLMRCCWKTDPRDRIKFPEIHERLLKAPPPPPLPPVPCSSPRVPQLPSVPIVTSLPLPPSTISCGSAIELLDADSYLLPIPKIAPEYLETLPN